MMVTPISDGGDIKAELSEPPAGNQVKVKTFYGSVKVGSTFGLSTYAPFYLVVF